MLAADAGAARLGGVISADDRRFEAVSARILEQPRLFQEMDEEALRENEDARAVRRGVLEQTTEGIRRVLIEALGTAEAGRLLNLGPVDLSTEFVATLERVLRRVGARYITKFRVRDLAGEHKHLLLHATASPHGVRAMKDAIAAALGRESLPERLRDRLREDLALDLRPISDRAADLFAGQTRPWARKSGGSLQDELLVATPMFPHQLRELKGLLKAQGWLGKLAGKEVVSFPERPVTARLARAT